MSKEVCGKHLWSPSTVGHVPSWTWGQKGEREGSSAPAGRVQSDPCTEELLSSRQTREKEGPTLRLRGKSFLSVRGRRCRGFSGALWTARWVRQ